MLTLCILGFLNEEPLHAYDLRARISGLSGHVRPVSDGALYPAVKRLEAAGHLTRHTEPGERATPRQVLTLTESGRAELMRRLREPAGLEITDRNSFFILLAFLGQLPTPPTRPAYCAAASPSWTSPAATSTRTAARCASAT